MKTFLTIFTIALVAQVTFAASISGTEGEFLVAFNALKQMVEEEKVMVEAVLKDMPKGDAYEQFRITWESFFDVYNDASMSCAVKVVGLVDAFAEFVGGYRADNAPPEAKEVLALFKKHGLDTYIENAKDKLKRINEAGEGGHLESC